MGVCDGVWEKLKSSLHPNSLFTYSTVKIVQIRDWRVGMIHRLVQFIIFAYVLGYVILWNQTYLAKESSYGTATTKVLGRSLGINANGDERFVDSSDLVYPASEPGAMFVATKYSLTSEQKVDYCPRNVIQACRGDSDCQGRSSGMKYKCNGNQCQYYQWCPEENDDFLPNNITDVVSLLNVNNFTVWIKSQISFPTLKPGAVFSTYDLCLTLEFHSLFRLQ
jgi:P2X purinoceptor 2